MLEVLPAKNGTFTATPDLTDGAVYMDEYVHYLAQKIGAAGSERGIRGYSLDNEPALWHYTHSRVHPDPVTVSELIEKSAATAAAVKAVDPDAEIFGPAVYGYTAYDHLADDDKSSEWETLKRQNRYHWYDAMMYTIPYNDEEYIYMDYFADEPRRLGLTVKHGHSIQTLFSNLPCVIENGRVFAEGCMGYVCLCERGMH